MTIPDSFPDIAIDASARVAEPSPRFSICALVTDPGEYRAVVDSFISHGFGLEDCEYLYLDNSSGNRFDAFRGYNIFLAAARGEFVILCHQDILLIDDDRAVLERRLAELSALDPAWAICGNAGGRPDGVLAIRISDPWGEDRNRGPFPARVMALDENFLVVRRDANLALSHDLSGFHFYATDLCTIADALGRTAYAIDFHLRHKSGGTKDDRFWAMRHALIDKYRRAFRPRWITTPCAALPLAGSVPRQKLLTFRSRVANAGALKGFVKTLVRAVFPTARRNRIDRGEDRQPGSSR